MKGMWVGYDVGCTMGLTLGHGTWQIDQPSNGSMWNSYSFQPVGQWMGYSFADLGAAGCCCSLNALITMFPSSYHHEIFRSYYLGQKWCWCKRSRSKVNVTEVKTQHSRFWTVTPVWIHIWQWNAHSLSSIEEVPYCFSRSSVIFQGHRGQKVADFDLNLAFQDCNYSSNWPMAIKLCIKLEVG